MKSKRKSKPIKHQKTKELKIAVTMENKTTALLTGSKTSAAGGSGGNAGLFFGNGGNGGSGGF